MIPMGALLVYIYNIPMQYVHLNTKYEKLCIFTMYLIPVEAL